MIYIIKNIESCNPKTIVDTLVKEVLSDKEITLDYLDKTRHRQITIDRQKIAQARLAIKF